MAWLVKEKNNAPHIPVFDKSKRTDGTFSRSDFTWEAEHERYICPAGNELKQFHRITIRRDRGSRPKEHGFIVPAKRIVMPAV